MVASNRDTRTLASTFSEYLAGNENTFVIIYDRLSILIDLLHDLETKQDEYKLLSIEASKSPVEFINRTEIVDDFDENTGWYKHNWIIHIHGEQSRTVEAFNSFFYYQLVGNVIKVDNFPALLEHRDIGLL